MALFRFFWRIFLLIISAVAGFALYFAVYYAIQPAPLIDKIAMTATYQPKLCTPGNPIMVTFTNRSRRTVGSVHFHFTATLAGHSNNQVSYEDEERWSDTIMKPGEFEAFCYALPTFTGSPDPSKLTYGFKMAYADEAAK